MCISIDHHDVQITGALSTARTVSLVLRGSNKLVLEEADRSLHDALCVIRCLVKNRHVWHSSTVCNHWPMWSLVSLFALAH